MADRPTPQMNFAGLQARLVPLVAELFATLASKNPLRMYFADIAGKTLLDVVQVLREEGVSQEAIAASFGLTMNGFRDRMRKLQDAHRAGVAVDAGHRTLLERVHAVIDEQAGPDGWTSADALTDAFRGTKNDTLQGVLTFLQKSALIEARGRGAKKAYRVVDAPVADELTEHDVQVTLYREGPFTLERLVNRLEAPEGQVEALLGRIRARGELEEREEGGVTSYGARRYHIHWDDVEGYEAAIYDHLAAVVGALCKKLRMRQHAASLKDLTGGATFTFYVPTDDPLWHEVSGYLRENRLRLEDWLTRARALEGQPHAPGTLKRVTIYVGQAVDDWAD
ncbi:hypothetical protein L6V77_22690 [Myxococcota bacterium]|nr:hypothetical protein [Myxococcota bacterium]